MRQGALVISLALVLGGCGDGAGAQFDGAGAQFDGGASIADATMLRACPDTPAEGMPCALGAVEYCPSNDPWDGCGVYVCRDGQLAHTSLMKLECGTTVSLDAFCFFEGVGGCDGAMMGNGNEVYVCTSAGWDSYYPTCAAECPLTAEIARWLSGNRAACLDHVACEYDDLKCDCDTSVDPGDYTADGEFRCEDR